MTYGPLDLPQVDDLRRGAALLAEQWPASRIGVRLDRAGAAWVHHPAGLRAAAAAAVDVVDVSRGHLALGVEAHTATVAAETPDDVVVSFVVSGDHITCLTNHAVGDASIACQLVPALVTAASTGVVPAGLLRAGTSRPVLRAVVRTYRKDPQLLLGPWRRARAARLRSSATGQVEAVGSPPAAGSTAPAPGRLEVRHAVMTRARLGELTRWRREAVPGASMATVIVSLARSALVEVGLPPTGAPGVLVDLRRYLAPEATYFGNLATGIALGTGAEWDPLALTRHLRASLDSALPLWDVARGEVIGLAADLEARALGRGRLLPVPESTGPAAGELPRPRLTVSTLPRGSALDALPWAAQAAEFTLVSLLTPSSPTAVTVSTSDLRGQLHLSVTFDGSVFDAGLLRRAVDLMASDPVALLRAHDRA